jgi:hypothetical protein
MNGRAWWKGIFVAGAMLLVPQLASAQAHAGLRAGVSGDPDQFYFGGHVETTPVAEHLTFRPNAEIGVGDNATLIALNIEFAYWLQMRKTRPWQVYVGAGPAANFYSIHNGGGSDVRGGLNFFIGAQHKDGLFTEFKVGAIDSPSVKFTVGYAFK